MQCISEAYRVLKPGGILYLAEFGRTTTEGYNVDYRKHALITGEEGNIVAFKPGLNISFKDKTDDEIKELGIPENITYFAHHFEEPELKELLSNFDMLEFRKEQFTTRSGNIANGFVVYAQKPLI